MTGGDTASANETRDAALAYLAKGWPVFAVDSVTGELLSRAPLTTREDVIAQWCRHPMANVAVKLGGASGLVTLTVVATATATRSLERLRERYALPGDPTILRSRGERVWLYRLDAVAPVSELAPGVQLKTDGIVMLPPSQTAREGLHRWRKGAWKSDRDPDLFPEIFWSLAKQGGLKAEPEVPIDAQPAALDDTWQQDLRRGRYRELLKDFANVCMLLEHDPEWAQKLSYNEMSLSPCLNGITVRDWHVSQFRYTLSMRYHVDFPKNDVIDALTMVAKKRPMHPVRSYLRSLVWDGVPRLERIAQEILGIEHPAPITVRMLIAFMIAATARVMDPGCKSDCVLVLYGKQGLKKSTFFDILASPWFSDSHLDITREDAPLKMAETWLYEWGEIGKLLNKKTSDEIKAFVSQKNDLFRAPYDRRPGWHPRSMLFVGTTNEEEFLNDPTGNRRYWVVTVPGRVNMSLLSAWKDQLWAEAVHAYDHGVEAKVDHLWYLNDEEELLRADASVQHEQEDPWRKALDDWLSRRPPTGNPFHLNDALVHALGLEMKDCDLPRQRRAGAILRTLGYAPKQQGPKRLKMWSKGSSD